MASIINPLIANSCVKNTGYYNKAYFIQPRLPWLDLAIGIILFGIGSLATQNLFSLTGSKWFFLAGTFEITVAAVVPCYGTVMHIFKFIINNIRYKYKNEDVDPTQPYTNRGRPESGGQPPLRHSRTRRPHASPGGHPSQDMPPLVPDDSEGSEIGPDIESDSEDLPPVHPASNAVPSTTPINNID